MIHRPVKINRALIASLAGGGGVPSDPAEQRFFGHALMLAERHHVTFVVNESGRGFYRRQHQTIEGPSPKDPAALAVFLHELGHREQDTSDEPDAWYWAIRCGGMWTVEMQDEMFRCLGTYAPQASAEDLDRMVWVIRQGSIAVQGKPWARDFDELRMFCDQFRSFARDSKVTTNAK